jgi:hypothetical protein
MSPIDSPRGDFRTDEDKCRKIYSHEKFIFRFMLTEAAVILGKGYSYSTILRRIESGEWQEGIHWIDDSTLHSQKRAIKINLTAVHTFRATPKAFRA